MGNVYVFKLGRYHEEVVGDSNPRSYYLLLAKLFDFWEMHPLRPEFVPLWRHSGVDTEVFKKKYVENTIISDSFTGMAPGWHFSPGIHKSWRLIELLPKDKEIKVPLVMYFSRPPLYNWVAGHVYEWHHRSGAANRLGWKTFPALKFYATGTKPGLYGMSFEDREELSSIQRSKGLPDISRICGVQIAKWTEEELRSYMYPRKEDNTKFNFQDMLTTKCIGREHPEWKKFGKGPIKLNAGHGVFKAPEVV